MKEIFKTIKQHFILLFGTGLFTYGLFSFDSGYYLGKTGGPLFNIDLGGAAIKSFPITTHYYYNQTSLVLLTIGAIFIVIGLLKMRKKEGKN